MKKKFTLKYLTSGIKNRDMTHVAQRLCEKWNKTGLLNGLNSRSRADMAKIYPCSKEMQKLFRPFKGILFCKPAPNRVGFNDD